MFNLCQPYYLVMTTTSTKHNTNLKSQESVSFLFFTETEYKLFTYDEVWYLPKWSYLGLIYRLKQADSLH